MMLVYPRFDLEIPLNHGRPTVLSIENQAVYSDFVMSLFSQAEGNDGSLHLLEKGTEKKIEKEVCLIANPLQVSCNDRKILSKLYAQLAAICNEEFFEKKAELNAKIISLLDSIAEQVPYHIEMNLDFEISDLLKIYDVKLDYQGTTLLERLVDYMRLEHQILGFTVFAAIGLKEYLTKEELESLYEMIRYEQVSLLMIEGFGSEPLKEEKNYIIDRDQCIIAL